MDTTVASFSTRSIPTGIFALPTIAVPSDLQILIFRLALNTPAQLDIWPDPNTLVTIQLDISTDGGETYTFGGSQQQPGGQHINRRTGQASPYMSMALPIDPAVTHVISSIKVEGGPCVTYGDILAN